MRGNRMGRVQEEVRRELGEILGRRVRDPRLQWISVTRVEVSRDLAVAKVYVSVLGDPESQEEALHALVKAAPFVRMELGRSLRLRRTPELRFLHDPGVEHSLRISRLLEELGISPGEGDPTAFGDPADGNDPTAFGDPADGNDPAAFDDPAGVDDPAEVDGEPGREPGDEGPDR